MSCYDWPLLLAHRFDETVEPPALWPEAEAHLASCAACRHSALRIDPTLAFRQAAAWVEDPGETAAIRRAVHTLRRASALESAGQSAAPRPRSRGPLAAAVLFAFVLALQPTTTARNPADPLQAERVATAPRLLRAAAPVAPAIEGVDRPDARVYEWGADDLSVVMVVDESLDV